MIRALTVIFFLNGIFGHRKMVRGPRPTWNERTTEQPITESQVYCDATKYFKPWVSENQETTTTEWYTPYTESYTTYTEAYTTGALRGPRPDLIPETSRKQCLKPDKDCFEWALGQSFRGPDSGNYAWNQIQDGRFADCNDDCVMFKDNHKLPSLNLCSFQLSKYTTEFNQQKNYIGFIFAAVRKNNVWYYNDKPFV